jgi:hypothetical protein
MFPQWDGVRVRSRDAVCYDWGNLWDGFQLRASALSRFPYEVRGTGSCLSQASETRSVKSAGWTNSKHTPSSQYRLSM